MIRNIQVYKHLGTDTFYARCLSTQFGWCEQWAETAEQASKKLRNFVCDHWAETWPEAEPATDKKIKEA